AFMDDVHEIDFAPGYQPEAHERFCLDEFELPDWLQDENSLSVPNLENISQHEEMVESIKGIAAFARNEQGEELILFQNFSRSHVIQPGNSLFLQNNTYETVQHKGFTLGGKLSAVYEVDQQRLLFHSFRTTNTFLPLAEFYEEASEQEIREVLDHNCLAPEDAEALAVGANQWFRKRFAMLRDSGILDNFTAKQIRKHSEGFEIDIQLKGNKIIFPSDKQEAKRLLQFLNEEIFRGAITETLYETNSKREAD
ncbi:Kiwa anti-phage protein KwaB-like domain-containing protein, partial [Thiolapillus sp.]|uniref:Kiwa anti-phage protein KwaB-like domain-containing protein n=16 Tax=Thiolapillus sp. TaxID=2017437 RepID=UPI003AF806D8